MKKKGIAPLWFLIELVAAIFVAYLIVNVSTAYAKGTIFEKLHIAKDLSLQINTLASVPGEAYIVNKGLHGYSLQFFNDRVEVFEDSSDQARGVYYFVKIGDQKLNLRLNKPEQVVISKINNGIIISEEIPEFS